MSDGDDIVRAAGPDDMAFVRESAAKVRWQKGITFRAHRAVHDRQLDQLIAAGGQILVATIHDVILGFVIGFAIVWIATSSSRRP